MSAWSNASIRMHFRVIDGSLIRFPVSRLTSHHAALLLSPWPESTPPSASATARTTPAPSPIAMNLAALHDWAKGCCWADRPCCSFLAVAIRREFRELGVHRAAGAGLRTLVVDSTDGLHLPSTHSFAMKTGYTLGSSTRNLSLSARRSPEKTTT
jgi:hypothetical protein